MALASLIPAGQRILFPVSSTGARIARIYQGLPVEEHRQSKTPTMSALLFLLEEEVVVIVIVMRRNRL